MVNNPMPFKIFPNWDIGWKCICVQNCFSTYTLHHNFCYVLAGYGSQFLRIYFSITLNNGQNSSFLFCTSSLCILGSLIPMFILFFSANICFFHFSLACQLLFQSCMCDGKSNSLSHKPGRLLCNS